MARLGTAKNVPYKSQGDKIEVKLKNHDWDVFFQREIAIKDTKAIKQLIADLRNYGVDLLKSTKKKHDTDWFGL